MRLQTLPSGALLAIAIALEVAGTLCLRVSEGFTQPLSAIGVLLGYGVSLVFFAWALSGGLGLGVAYGTLTACGLAAAALLSAFLFGESLGVVQVVGLIVLAAGVVALTCRRAVAHP